MGQKQQQQKSTVNNPLNKNVHIKTAKLKKKKKLTMAYADKDAE